MPGIPLAFALALPALAADPPVASPDTATAPVPRIVKRLEEFVVRSSLYDPASGQTVHALTPRTLSTLPVDDLAGALALRPGVVAQGGELHVRGGRTGEFRYELEGVPLNDPYRDRPFELPFVAVHSAELITGGLDAEYGGALAGVLNLHTFDPGPRASGEVLWRTDFGLGTRYDRVGLRLGAPVPGTAWGVVASGEATLDDTSLPSLRTDGRHDVLGASLGWRADNRLAAHVKIAPLGSAPRVSLQLFGFRRVERPFDPMWSLDGWTTRCADPDCILGARYSPEELPGYERYRAADHLAMTDERSLGAVFAWTQVGARHRARAAAGWTATRSLTSVGGWEDDSYVTPESAPVFGEYDSDTSDPFLVYLGEDPLFRRRASDALTVRGDYAWLARTGSRVQVGGGATYHAVSLHELDGTLLGRRPGLDSLRAYRAYAPGAFLFAQGRWIFEGLILNAGLRVELFTAGPQAQAQSYGSEARAVWTLSPRLGFAFPISTRDVLSFSYVRLRQAPGRDFLYDNRRLITTRQPLGNPGLVPATAISYEASAKHLFDEEVSLQLSIFYRDLYGLVGAHEFVPPGAAPVRRYENADQGNARGFEVSAVGSRERAWIAATYTFLEARGTQSLEEGDPYGLARGPRPPPIQVVPLDWDLRHEVTLSASWQPARAWSLSWVTRVGSGLPWTPRQRRQLDASLALVNSERFAWAERSDLSLRWAPRLLGRKLILGLDVRNVFDHRSDAAATVDGYPNLLINTVYDDYGAYRAETGNGGGAYYDDVTGDGLPGWVPVGDPRLGNPPRAARISLGVKWGES